MKNEKQSQVVDLVVKGGKVVTPTGIFTGGVAVKDGIIVSVGTEESLPKAIKVIDTQGNYIIPGVIDQETHIGMNRPLPDDFASESRGAIATGITTWGFQQSSARWSHSAVEAPKEYHNQEDIPGIAEGFSYFKEMGERYLMTDFFCTPILLSDLQVAEIPEVAERFGITSFKFYMHMKAGASRMSHIWPQASQYGFLGFDDGTVFQAMENVAHLGPPAILCLHCENWEIARIFEKRLKEAGRKDMAAWDAHSPHFCEAGHVKTYAYYAKAADCPLFINHVTTAETLDEIVKARSEGVRIIGNVQPCYLSLTHDTWKINVPLRDRESIDALWIALRDGIISSVSSDHVNRGRTRQQMEVSGDMWATESGFSSRVESLLPVMLSEGVNKGRISMQRLVEVCCENPAKIFGLYPKKGALMVGADADMVIVDLGLTRKVTNDMIHSSAGWTIYEGWEMKGWPVLTILRGNVMVEWPEGEVKARIVSDPIGKYIPRKLGSEFYPIQQSVDELTGKH